MRFLPFLLLVLAFPASAIQYQRHVLSNGLTVLLYKDDSAPLVAINVWYKVGSKNEKAGRTGFAHLFEHYMFECTKHLQEGEYFKRVFKDLGGLANAFTSYDMTNYYAVVPSGGMDEVMRLESSRMGYLQECMSLKSLDKQRGIVKNEKRLREGEPYGTMFEEVMGQTFQAPHPYHWPIIGYMKDLDAATLKDVADFNADYYLPNNAVLVVAGAVDAAVALARAKFWFEGIKKGPAPPALNVPAVGGLGGRREKTVTDHKAQMPMLVLAFPIPGKGKPGYNEMNALSSVLSDGRGSRLQKALKYGAKPLAVMVSAGVLDTHENGVFLIQAIPAPGVTMGDLEKAIRAELDAVTQSGIKPEELKRVQARLKTAFYDGLQSVEGVARALAEGEAVAGDPEIFIDGEVSAIDALTPQAVGTAAQRLKPDDTSVVKIVPDAK